MVHPPAALGRDYLKAFEREARGGSVSSIKNEADAGLLDVSLTAGTQQDSQKPANGPGNRRKPATYTGLSNAKAGLLPPVAAPGRLREFTVEAMERPLNVAHGTIFPAWTFNGTVPGPVIRATEGETLKINFRNLTSGAHSLHFHGAHDPHFDGWEPIPAGKSTEYILQAGPFGVHPYHCHTAPISMHIAKGMFGALIVDPAGGRPPAREVVLILHGYDLANRGRNDLFCWNGIAGYYDRYPIRVKVGELVRLYVVNMVEYDPIASFHLHARTFDVYRTGTRMTPDEHTDVVTLGQTERAVLEMRFTKKGRYMFHPHQSYMAEKGAMGWIVAI
ncbi:MAG: multicopper oxidase domain-containing protein [Leptospiraceae bacterium]|nr:multicopper oxidase domain-containing protein [Leptospiraceae bacterium]